MGGSSPLLLPVRMWGWEGRGGEGGRTRLRVLGDQEATEGCWAQDLRGGESGCGGGGAQDHGHVCLST